MNWIPITERLPEKEGFYLFWYNDDKVGLYVYYVPAIKPKNENITHWLEITGPAEDFCEWKVNGEYNAYTSCGTIVGFRNTFNFCPNCGRKIKEVKDESGK